MHVWTKLFQVQIYNLYSPTTIPKEKQDSRAKRKRKDFTFLLPSSFSTAYLMKAYSLPKSFPPSSESVTSHDHKKGGEDKKYYFETNIYPISYRIRPTHWSKSWFSKHVVARPPIHWRKYRTITTTRIIIVIVIMRLAKEIRDWHPWRGWYDNIPCRTIHLVDKSTNVSRMLPGWWEPAEETLNEHDKINEGAAEKESENNLTTTVWHYHHRKCFWQGNRIQLSGMLTVATTRVACKIPTCEKVKDCYFQNRQSPPHLLFVAMLFRTTHWF